MKLRRNSGRKPETGTARNVTLEFRVTTSEKSEVEQAADACGMSVSAFIRESLKAAMTGQGE